MIERFAVAQERAGTREVELTVAHRNVRLRFAGDRLAEAVMPALAHLVDLTADFSTERPRALTVHLWDTRSTGVDMIPAPWEVGPGGAIPEAVAQGLYATYRPECDMLVVVDGRAGLGVVWMHDAKDLPRHDRAAPLRSVFAAFFAALGPVVTHAGAVGLGGRGVLLGGRGGSGKSTTTMLCLAAGFDYAGDDYVLVEVDGQAPRVHSLYATSKLLAPDVPRVPSLAQAYVDLDESESPDKAITFLHPHFAPQLTAGFPLVALLLPVVTRRPGTALVPISPAVALRRLAPSTIFQQDIAAQPVLASLGRLVQRLPCLSLELGTELEAIPEVISGLLARSAP